MSYSDILRQLYARSPKGIKLGLERVRKAARRLEISERDLKCVQIAGTNGKGSVAALVAHAAERSGLEVGLFTSPHLHRFSERIRLGSREVDEGELEPVLEEVLKLCSTESFSDLTFFEIATLAALRIFSERGVKLAVLEVGLGGRLDATSIVRPCVTAITSIALDHMDYLGATLAAIAREKAGIVRKRVPLVAGVLPDEALRVVREITRQRGAPLLVLDRDFGCPPDLDSPWPGLHQRRNTAVALKVWELACGFDPENAKRIFSEALSTAKWPGRYETIRGRPRVLLDGAHNEEAMRALIAALDERGDEPETLVFGALRGKPISEMLKLLRPRVKNVILTRPPVSRAQDPVSYAEPGDVVVRDPEDALKRAAQITKPAGLVLVTGSFFHMAAIRAVLCNERMDPMVSL